MVLTRALPFAEGDRTYTLRLSRRMPDPAFDLMLRCLTIEPKDRPTIKEVADSYWLSDEYLHDLARQGR
jgi:serine/threonine protein kinase